MAAAEQALAPDAAARRRDRSHFGISMYSNVILIYRGGAGEAQGVSPQPATSLLFQCSIMDTHDAYP